MNRHKILIVDDESVNHMLLEAILGRYDYEIHIANDGIEAINKVNTIKFDLIFMDIRMPRMGGVEATEIIKSKYPTLPVIAITAFSLFDIKSSVFDLILNKPVIFDNIDKLLNFYLK